MEQYTQEELEELRAQLVYSAIKDVHAALILDKWIDRIDNAIISKRNEVITRNSDWYDNMETY